MGKYWDLNANSEETFKRNSKCILNANNLIRINVSTPRMTTTLKDSSQSDV